MRTIYFDKPLGMGEVYAPSRKEWIASVIGAGAGLLSSWIGGSAASKAAEEANRELRAKKARDDAYYTRRYYEDYIDTKSGQNLVRRAKQMYDRNIKRAAGAKAVAGGTDASVQMAKDSANQALGDTMANIAAMDTQRKDRADAQHRMDEQNYTQQRMAIENQRAQNITNAAQNASNAMIAAGSAVDQASATRSSLSGGSNNSSEFKGVNVTDLETPDSNTTMYTSAATGLSGTVDDWRKAIIGK